MKHDALLGSLSISQFLQDYWQKKPLFIPDAIQDYHCPITAEELAGLACEEDVESRIVREQQQAPLWECFYGPFSEQQFEQLPETHWTLLVQECNKYFHELALLLDRFNFIPNWRVDDVMVSYAPEHGSVGPHLDQYDVFLIQAEGTRRWQINTRTYDNNDFIDDIDLQILKSFEAEQEWVVKPGDILYLPPGVSHYGVALEDCITISIGFRAPSYSDLLSSYTEQLISQLDGLGESAEAIRYKDPDLVLQDFSGELNQATINKIKQLLQNQFNRFDQLEYWFGRFATEPKHEPLPPLDPHINRTLFLNNLQAKGELYRSEYSRFVYIDQTHTQCLFIDGLDYPISSEQIPLVRFLCNQRHYSIDELEPYLKMDNTLELLLLLFNNTKLYFEDETFDTDNPME